MYPSVLGSSTCLSIQLNSLKLATAMLLFRSRWSAWWYRFWSTGDILYYRKLFIIIQVSFATLLVDTSMQVNYVTACWQIMQVNCVTLLVRCWQIMPVHLVTLLVFQMQERRTVWWPHKGGPIFWEAHKVRGKERGHCQVSSLPPCPVNSLPLCPVNSLPLCPVNSLPSLPG